MTRPLGTDRAPEIAAYAQDVRAALADVPPSRLAELLEDLEDHLAEVAAESDEPLLTRLGPSSVYAAELRQAAGLPEGVPAAARAGSRRADLAARLEAARPVRATVDFLPELRPAWWVARAWLGLLALDLVLFGQSSSLLPTFGLGPVGGLLVTGAAVVSSVRLGRRTRAEADPARRPLALALNGALALLAVVAVVGLATGSAVAQSDPYPVYETGNSSLTHEDDAPITNIYPYSPTGEPLSGVLLYDQDGRALDDLSEWTEDGEPVERVVTPGAPPQPANAYPQQQRVVVYDQWGQPIPAPPAAPAPPALPGPVVPTPEPTP